MMAENYHNIWAKKKKIELESKGNAFSKPALRSGALPHERGVWVKWML